MTDRMTPERLAELRRPYDQGEPDTLENLLELMATGHDGWLTKGRQVWARHLAAYQADHAALIGEIDRLTAEVEQLADFAVLTSRPKELQAERDRAVQRWHDEHHRAETLEKALAEARAQVRAACCGPWHDYEISKIDEARFPNERLNAARTVANRWHTYAHTRVRTGPGPDAAAWSVALTAMGFVLRELDDDGTRPRDDAHSDADSPQAPSGGDETPRAETEPQRPAEDFRTYRCPTPCDPGCEHRCHEGHHPDRTPSHNIAECQARRAAAEAYRRFAPKTDTSTAPVLDAPLEDVLALAQCTPLRTPDEWCAHYGVEIRDPDGWRRPGDPRSWGEPITLAEFWNRAASSTIADINSDAWQRIAHDAEHTDELNRTGGGTVTPEQEARNTRRAETGHA